MLESFILIAYVVGTAFGYYVGKSNGLRQGISSCIDNLIAQGYLKFRGPKSNPDILKYDED